jgi:hypothetical protein
VLSDAPFVSRDPEAVPAEAVETRTSQVVKDLSILQSGIEQSRVVVMPITRTRRNHKANKDIGNTPISSVLPPGRLGALSDG